ncbi:MAG: helix-turn-helix transcriptional regulator [Betaproteobacteria bacterium]|nr:helix-turn-helix transcriptional regulator [Betaproteobacteria bacterium]
MPTTLSPSFAPDLALTRDAIASSALSHGLLAVGDRWTSLLLRGAFTGVRRFEDWQSRLGIPRPTLSDRLRKLVALGLLRQRPHQERPRRNAYHLTRRGLGLYGHVLMIWAWERRWGSRRDHLPTRLVHRACGQAFEPVLSCQACGSKTGLADLRLGLEVNATLLAAAQAAPRSGRMPADPGGELVLGQRLDRWTLLIVSALILGCHHFDQLRAVLGIASSVLSRRLASMADSGLLQSHIDLRDGRRTVYRLTPASRDLFAYMACFSTWASRELLRQPSSIRPVHKDCGRPFAAVATCSACGEPLQPWDVSYDPAPNP